ncbi:MAG: hypothetical protein WAV21_03780 [Minisyncoccia bacterium]
MVELRLNLRVKKDKNGRIHKMRRSVKTVQRALRLLNLQKRKVYVATCICLDVPHRSASGSGWEFGSVVRVAYQSPRWGEWIHRDFPISGEILDKLRETGLVSPFKGEYGADHSHLVLV